jgi:hypothetical protein
LEGWLMSFTAVLARLAMGVSALALLAAAPARADIAGRVVDDLSGQPLQGALVMLRARDTIAPVTTGVDGSFVLPLPPLGGTLEIAAAVAYSADAPVNYLISTQQVFDGMSGVELRLFRSPANDNPAYVPPAADQMCVSCHGRYFQQWSASRHAGSALNPWVLDLYSGDGTPGGSAGYVFRDTHDADDTGFCATCHAPLEDVLTPGGVFLNEVSSDAGLDGVTCLSCHQIAHVDEDNINALHHRGKTEYRFPQGDLPTEWYVFGPLADVSDQPMRAHYSPLHEQPLLCAACHQYTNPKTGAPGQSTYEEWLASPYAQPGPGHRTCQDCHMPKETSAGTIGSGGPNRPASQRSTHRFIGATPDRLSENIDLRLQMSQQGSQLVVTAEVENSCGHNFPTGISIRNALLLLDVRVGGVALVQNGGPVIPAWANDDVPGIQPGDYAGLPGKGYAKVLQGRINGTGPVVSPVLFIDAESVQSSAAVPSGQTDSTEFRFAIPTGLPPGASASIDARLLYRRAWRALAVTKGWTQTPGGMPIEIQVQRRTVAQPLEPVGDGIFADGFEAP